jgi:hypothetical protein
MGVEEDVPFLTTILSQFLSAKFTVLWEGIMSQQKHEKINEKIPYFVPCTCHL